MQPARLALLAASVAACSPTGEATLPSQSGAAPSDAVARTSGPDGLEPTDPGPESPVLEALSLVPDDAEFIIAGNPARIADSKAGQVLIRDFQTALRAGLWGALECGVSTGAGAATGR
jgi:hypothetical protein